MEKRKEAQKNMKKAKEVILNIKKKVDQNESDDQVSVRGYDDEDDEES